MLRLLSIVPILMSMMMVTLATVLPHHHHQTMICIAEATCGHDGCLDCTHEHHSDTSHNDDESHCVAHEQYCPSERLQIDHKDFGSDWDNIFPILAILSNQLAISAASITDEYACGNSIPILVPPLSYSVAPNAPPVAS